jgi:hypothetical protein
MALVVTLTPFSDIRQEGDRQLPRPQHSQALSRPS